MNLRPLWADPIPERLVRRTFDGALVASGDLLQKGRAAGEVDSRMVFRFEDGNVPAFVRFDGPLFTQVDHVGPRERAA